MYTTSLLKVGGSVMMAVPPALLELLELEAGSVMAVSVEGERLVLEARRQPHYRLQELLDQCDFSLPETEEERDWLRSGPVGEELI